jgi:predicted small integral membrane protein
MSKLDQKLLDKLQELIQVGEQVKQTKYSRSGRGIVHLGDSGVNYELAHQWGTSCLNLLSRVSGPDSVHYRNFERLFPNFRNYSPVTQALGVLKAAKDDYEQGFLFDTRVLIEAEVFDDFLEQAEQLLASGYYQPAAVVIGSVLEDGLRKLCRRGGIALSDKAKLDSMNSNLAKKGVYNKLMHKRVTMLADIRNRAAHGEWDKFSEADVEGMLSDVRRLMETHFS